MRNFNIIPYIQPLGKKVITQFEKSLKKSGTILEKELEKHIYDGTVYYPVSYGYYTKGRNHNRAAKVAAGTLKMEDNSFFANSLMAVDSTDPTYHYPSKRVFLGPLQIYTFEFDEADLAFFCRQLSWLRSSGKSKTDSVIGKLYKKCSKWADFLGITVVWSGNKSFHFHIAFETHSICRQMDKVPDSPRAGLKAHWDLLAKTVYECFGIDPAEYELDDSLRHPEQYRRLPNGHRRTKDNHLLSIPANTLVPQLPLWEEWRGRVAPNVTELFHRPNLFAEPVRKYRVEKRQTNIVIPTSGQYTPDEIAHCEDRLREIYPNCGWPRLNRISFDGGYWKAFFFNSASDNTPSSVMREDYPTIGFFGRDSHVIKSTPLEEPLGIMMAEWVLKMHDPIDEDVYIDSPEHEATHRIERDFASASSKDEARQVT
ncbi:hypothetical protein [Aquisediminimonas sediminicola]|uniref:hypothetical protein n=1 Tax=Alteraquisediminimonas sediminicola TaxID=2676787 RepID=UPI001C8D916A|nr:hypothetical protein [Aquisediminimonas sediminicola]